MEEIFHKGEFDSQDKLNQKFIEIDMTLNELNNGAVFYFDKFEIGYSNFIELLSNKQISDQVSYLLFVKSIKGISIGNDGVYIISATDYSKKVTPITNNLDVTVTVTIDYKIKVERATGDGCGLKCALIQTTF